MREISKNTPRRGLNPEIRRSSFDELDAPLKFPEESLVLAADQLFVELDAREAADVQFANQIS